jgi:hypothetical protein
MLNQSTIRRTSFGVVSILIAGLFSSCQPADVAKVEFVTGDIIKAASGPSPSPVPITIDGANLANCADAVFDSGAEEGLSGSVTSATADQVTMTLTAAQNAALGSHTITLDCGVNGPVKINTFVKCPSSMSCPELPRLSIVDPAPGSNFPAQGETTQMRFTGTNLQNLSPVVVLDPTQGTGLTFSPAAPTTVYKDGTTEYFDLPLIVDSSAPTGNHRVRVQTTGGRTAWVNINVRDRFGRLLPPNGVPILTDIRLNTTPDTLAPDTDVFIECMGRGFGVSREVITTPSVPTTTYSVSNPAAHDPDAVVVAKIHPLQAGAIKVQVRNVDTNAITDDIRLYVAEVVPDSLIARNNATDGVHRGGSYTLQVTGQNLRTVTNASWSSGLPLTFSNSHATDTTASVTVTAPPNMFVTGDIATNVYLKIGSNADDFYKTVSPPFALQVLP